MARDRTTKRNSPGSSVHNTRRTPGNERRQLAGLAGASSRPAPSVSPLELYRPGSWTQSAGRVAGLTDWFGRLAKRLPSKGKRRPSTAPTTSTLARSRWARSSWPSQPLSWRRATSYSQCALRLGSPDDDRSTSYGRSKTHEIGGETCPCRRSCRGRRHPALKNRGCRFHRSVTGRESMTLPVGSSAQEKRKAYLPKHANTSAPRPLPGHDQPVQTECPGRTGPGGFARSVTAPPETEAPPTGPTGEGGRAVGRALRA